MEWIRKVLLMMLVVVGVLPVSAQASWMADNGNGTYTNPLFYDEFSDPDIIRVGDDYYLAGTTMHCVPGVVILHSRDLVNWSFESYCMDRFDLGPQFQLADGKEAYGQGVWAPCIRYHEGKFYVFTNINGVGMQVFIADSPRGPWTHKNMGGDIYDLSVLFDDDGRIYAVHKYGSVHLVEIKPDFSGYVEGSDREIISEGNAMGEGHHFYKINGKYYILSADYSPMGRMQCARADRIEGPYETVTVSAKTTLGTQTGLWNNSIGLGSPLPGNDFEFSISGPGDNRMGCATVHQGGIVDLPNGEWWGVSMLDFRSVGRTVCLAPITWKEGWPYFGLEGNLGQTPRTWLKPAVGGDVPREAPYRRSGFTTDGKRLNPVWQWNHKPVDGKWKLAQGTLVLKTMVAKDFLWARNTLTQRCIGPVSEATVTLDVRGLRDGDAAGLGLLNIPYAWIGVERDGRTAQLVLRDQLRHVHRVVDGRVGHKVWLRITGDFDNDRASMAYSHDGEHFVVVTDSIAMPYQLKTFQGSRYSLFAFNSRGKAGGTARFSDYRVVEPMADRTGNLPVGKVITLTNLADGSRLAATAHGIVHVAGKGTKDFEGMACRFKVIDTGHGQVMLQAMNGTGYLTVVGEGLSADVRLMAKPTAGSRLMWQDMLRGQCMLLSMKTHRYIGTDVTTGEPYSADWWGTTPNRRNGTVFAWDVVGE